MQSSVPLSLTETDALLAKAALKASQSDFSGAFPLYIKAAQAYLHLSRTLTLERGQAAKDLSELKARCREKASQALQRAEQIKGAKDTPGESSSPPPVKPVRRDRFSIEEQYAVIDQSSRINKFKVTPWKSPLSNSEFTSPHLFVDPAGLLSLSPTQTNQLLKWIRPSSMGAGSGFIMLMEQMSPEDIVQDAVTNCSVIAALAVCWQHHQRFNSKLCISSIYPQDESGNPRLSQNGMYAAKLLINGAPRQIVIDDRLPVGKAGRLLCASTASTNTLWPALLEKAYLKVLGGYDFPGSNSAFDIYALTGWIPEQLDFRSSSFQREKTWNRLVTGFDAGHCVFTLGTGEEVRRQPRAMKLISRHNYAVLAVEESSNGRNVKVFNPWRTPIPQSSSGSGVAVASAGELTASCHWIDWDEACQIFDTGFLNWDPGRLFSFTRAFHGVWSSDHKISDRLNTQLRISPVWQSKSSSLTATPELWVLMTQHVTSTEGRLPFTAINVIRSVGEGCLTRQDLLGLQTAYTDGMHTLCRLLLHRQDSHLTLVLSREMDSNVSPSSGSAAYTVAVYSNMDFRLTDPLSTFVYCKKVEGNFTPITCGGHSQHRTFMRNPQYSLRFQPSSGITSASASNLVAIRIIMEASRDMALNLSIVWGNGKRVTALHQGDIQLSTGPYTYGIAMAEGKLKPGNYTLIASTFEPGKIGRFSISIEGDSPAVLEPIMQEGAGMYSKVIKGSWLRTSASNTSLGRKRSYARYSLRVVRPTTILCRLQSIPTGGDPSHITFNIFSSGASPGDLGPQAVTGGPYSDRVSGVANEPILLQGPEKYTVVMSTMEEASVGAEFEFTAYSSACPVVLEADEADV
ncbi:cysteine protease [Tulasnella sp. JGI-2019a]|nr:cysteine protease [Tulasnella sp. JGI-2019a]